MSDPSTHTPPRALAARSVADVLRSCAVPMGVPVAYLESARVSSVTREAGSDAVVHTFARGSVALVSLPSSDAGALDLDDQAVHELIALTRSEANPGAVVTLNGVRLELDDEAASLVVADGTTLVRTKPHVPAALVYDPRPMALDMLRHDVSAADWSKGGADIPSRHRVGALAGGVLVALASVDMPSEHIARVRVVVAPGQRRRGVGRLVLDTLAANVVKQGLIPYARLAEGDAAGHALAASVGFVPFARALTLRVSRTPSFASGS